MARGVWLVVVDGAKVTPVTVSRDYRLSVWTCVIMFRIYVWLCVLVVSMGGFLWGYDTGSINGVKEMRGFRNTFNITFNQIADDNRTNGAQCGSTDDVETSALVGAIVSVFPIGALMGALLSGLLSDLAGRKVTVIIGASSCAIGTTLQTSSIYLWMLFPGRAISGIGAGILLQACPLYIAEIAPKERRGTMVAMIVSFWITAIVIGVITNAIVEGYPFGWRISISVQIIVAIILICGAIFLPETPRFLLKKRKDTKALAVLKKIYKEQRKAEDEVINIQQSLGQSTSLKGCTQTLRFCCSGSIIQRALIGFTLMLLSRAVGGPIIIYYSVSIFCKFGVDGFLGSIVLFVLMFFGQIAGVALVDKCGRKSLLLFGAVVLGLSLTSAAALIQIFNLEDDSDLNVGRKVAGYLVIALICLSMIDYNMTYSSVGWVILSEIYPLRIRGVGTALGQIGWWGGTFLMGEIGPILLSSPLRTSGTFYLLSGMCVLSYLHILLLVPETKGRSLEDIEVLFTESWFKKADIFYYLRCGYFCCFSRRRRQIRIEAADYEEREQLQEPLDQISLSSLSGSVDR